MLKPNDRVICVDASGPYMDHLEKGKEYIVERIDGVNLKLVGVEYTTKVWRFVFALDKAKSDDNLRQHLAAMECDKWKEN